MNPEEMVQSHIIDLSNFQLKSGGYPISFGSFSTIFLVEHSKSHKMLAAKVYHEKHNSTFEKKKFICKKILVLIQVRAPTIISFYGFSFTDFAGRPNITIIMDYKEKGSLEQLIFPAIENQSSTKLDSTTKQIILCGIAHGMSILHKNNILHRDLKPDNVLLDKDNKPFITDFGLAKIINPSISQSQSIGASGALIYAAPETLCDDPKFSKESDVYSFGILMHEVLTCEQAYYEEINDEKYSVLNLADKIKKGKRPKSKTPIKPIFQDLIEKCWSQDPSKRPTFQDLYEKLSLHNEKEAIIAAKLRSIILDEPNTERKRDSLYCLDDVDINKLFHYIEEIENSATQNEQAQFNLDEEIESPTHFIEENEQNELINDQLNLSKQENGIMQLTQNSINPKQFNEKQNNSNETIEECPIPNPLEGLTFTQMKKKIDYEKIRKVWIPSSFAVIGSRAFLRCETITQIVIPETVTSIEKEAFCRCNLLKKVIIPSSVISIGPGAFYHCYSLHEIKLPSSVSFIGHDAFCYCEALTKFEVPSLIKSIPKNLFWQCYTLQKISLPSITSIGDQAFSQCRDLKSITIPSTVASIGENAFYYL